MTPKVQQFINGINRFACVKEVAWQEATQEVKVTFNHGGHEHYDAASIEQHFVNFVALEKYPKKANA